MTDITRLQRLGNSTGLALRKELLTRAGFRRGDEVRLLAAPGEIRVLAAAGPFARCLQLGEALSIRYGRVLRALLAQAAAGTALPGTDRRPGSPSAPGPTAPRPQPPQSPAAKAATDSLAGLQLPPAAALLSLQRGPLAALAQARGDQGAPATAATEAAIQAALDSALDSAQEAATQMTGTQMTGTDQTGAPAEATAEATALAGLAAATILALRRQRPTGSRTAAALAFLAGNLVLELNGRYLDVTDGAAMAALEGLDTAEPDSSRSAASQGKAGGAAGGGSAGAALARWIDENSYPLHRWYP